MGRRGGRNPVEEAWQDDRKLTRRPTERLDAQVVTKLRVPAREAASGRPGAQMMALRDGQEERQGGSVRLARQALAALYRQKRVAEACPERLGANRREPPRAARQKLEVRDASRGARAPPTACFLTYEQQARGNHSGCARHLRRDPRGRRGLPTPVRPMHAPVHHCRDLSCKFPRTTRLSYAFSHHTPYKLSVASEFSIAVTATREIIVHSVVGPKNFSVRLPVAAGRFYPDEPSACRDSALALLRAGQGKEPDVRDTAGRGWGGIVPHAGWICSGAIAGQMIADLARRNRDVPPDVVVVFGAVHTPIEIERAALDSHDVWKTPGGASRIDEDLVRQLRSAGQQFVMDDRFHRQEHAVEVELPLIQAAWPNAALLPIEVPLIHQAVGIGRETAQRVLAGGKNAVFFASSDLTHYGPVYRFAPAGIGLDGLAWARSNDERLLRLVADFAVDKVVPEVVEHANACGGGAIAAMLAACKEAGATQTTLLRHANSHQMLAGIVRDDPSNAVGYAAVVVS